MTGRGSEDKVSAGCWPEEWAMKGLGDSPLGKREQPGGLPRGDKGLATQVKRGSTKRLRKLQVDREPQGQ